MMLRVCTHRATQKRRQSAGQRMAVRNSGAPPAEHQPPRQVTYDFLYDEMHSPLFLNRAHGLS